MEDEEDLADVEAGPENSMGDEDEAPDDEDGRFFGGGVTKGTAEVLDFLNEREGEDDVGRRISQDQGRPSNVVQAPGKFDVPWLRRLALSFEKRISKNAELRAKFEDTPQKYVEQLYCIWWVTSDHLTDS